MANYKNVCVDGVYIAGYFDLLGEKRVCSADWNALQTTTQQHLSANISTVRNVKKSLPLFIFWLHNLVSQRLLMYY